jgi:hypothetical protein
MEVEIALFIHDMKNLRQSISRFDNSFVDIPPTRENESHIMLAIFYRTASKGRRLTVGLANQPLFSLLPSQTPVRSAGIRGGPPSGGVRTTLTLSVSFDHIKRRSAAGDCKVTRAPEVSSP